jgi:hypothetical protein
MLLDVPADSSITDIKMLQQNFQTQEANNNINQKSPQHLAQNSMSATQRVLYKERA